MRGRRLGIAVVVAGSMAAGGIAGATLGVPGLSGAATTPWPADLARTAGEDGGPAGRHAPGPRGALFDAAARALGLSTGELLDKLRDGETTIADVATERNVDLDAVIDAMAAAAREHVEEMVHDPLPKRRPGGPGLPGAQGGPGHAGSHRPGFALGGLDAAAEALGTTVDELRDALRTGRTLADVAGEKQVAVEALVAAMVADARAHIDEARANGRISAARAEELAAGLEERITAFVNDGLPKPPFGGERRGARP